MMRKFEIPFDAMQSSENDAEESEYGHTGPGKSLGVFGA